MLKNYFMIAVRNLFRNRIYSLINIVGFALGLAVFLIISLVVIDDLSYDRFHSDAANTYRFLTTNRSTRNVNAITSGALTKEVGASIPEAIATTRVFGFGQIDLSQFGGPESEQGVNRRVLGTDSTFFKVFPSFEILEGDPDKQLKTPNTALVTREVARALFGDENPLGQTVNSETGNFQVTITGIVMDCPKNSHIQYDIIVPALVNENNSVWWESWDNVAGHGYLRAQPGTSEQDLETKIQQTAELNGMNEQYLPSLQPLSEVHLGSTGYRFDVLNFGKSDRTQVVMLSAIAMLTLIIAAFNFINLSSARAVKRAREVGMRKVVGANRSQLMIQFLGESIMLTTISMVLAGIIVEAILPSLTQFLGKEVTYTLSNSPLLILALLGVSIVVGLLAGIYPAIVLAGFKPASVLKGAFQSSRQGVFMRQALVVCQFAISIALIVSVLIVLGQLKYVTTMDRGYSLDQVATTFTFNQQVAPQRDAYISRLKQVPSILAVGSTNNMPGFRTTGRIEGRPEDSITDENNISFYNFTIGDNFIPALDIKLVAGREFSADGQGDLDGNIIINTTAMRALGWEDPIGRRIIVQDVNGNEVYKTIVGVVKDFHITNARQPMEPLYMEYAQGGGGFVFFRIQGGQITETMDEVRAIWEEMFPDVQFFSAFADDVFNQQYNDDRNFATKVGVFSGLAIVIAILGLIGLTSYSTEQRRREIAVRKVLGSGEVRIITLLTSDFVKWVVLANAIGWPVAYFAMKRWLADFVFRVQIGPMPFIIAGLIAIVLAALTVSVLAWRASLMNPANVLRQE